MYLPGIGPELALKLREHLAHQGTRRAAAGEYEIQQDRTPIVHLLRQGHDLAVVANESHCRHGIPNCFRLDGLHRHGVLRDGEAGTH
jgi:hypothetical protein